jgi:oligopeptide transport system ATP-binding protein
MTLSDGTLLEVKDLRTYSALMKVPSKVDGVICMRRGQTVGIVGEPGSGKSVANLR